MNWQRSSPHKQRRKRRPKADAQQPKKGRIRHEQGRIRRLGTKVTATNGTVVAKRTRRLAFGRRSPRIERETPIVWEWLSQVIRDGKEAAACRLPGQAETDQPRLGLPTRPLRVDAGPAGRQPTRTFEHRVTKRRRHRYLRRKNQSYSPAGTCAVQSLSFATTVRFVAGTFFFFLV